MDKRVISIRPASPAPMSDREERVQELLYQARATVSLLHSQSGGVHIPDCEPDTLTSALWGVLNLLRAADATLEDRPHPRMG